MSMRYPGGLIATTPVNQQFPSGVWTGPQSAPYQANNVWANDSSFKNTTLLLHGDGATTPFIKDASTNNFQIAISGDTKQANNNPYITNGYWSNYFDGSGDYLSVSYNSAFAFPGDFTVEFWVNYSSHNQYAGMVACCQSGSITGWQIIFNSTSNNILVEYTGGSFTSSATLDPYKWNHVALVRSGSSMVLYINGVSSGTATTSATLDSGSSALLIGVERTPLYYTTGYISNVRVVKGTAVYTGAFTPPTSPLTAISGTSLLTCQSNRLIDNSTNAFTVTKNGDVAVSSGQPFTPISLTTYGSGYFDGSGDYLTPPSSSAFAYGTGDLTVECWIYATVASDSPIYESRSTNSNTDGFTITAFTSTVIRVYTTSALVTATVPNYVNAWTHVAYTRQGSTNRLFVNGVLSATATASDNFSNTTAFIGGGRYASSSVSAYFTGYISNVRILKGTAQYTATFTPPSAPLPLVTNTSLLTLQTNGPATNNTFLDNAPSNLLVARNGNTNSGSFTPYRSNGNWSNYFGGAGNYLTTPSGSATTIVGTINSSLNLCIECWVYLNEYSGTSSFPALIGNMDPSIESDDWSFGPVSTGALMFYWYDGGQKRAYTTSTIPLNTWTHIAVNISTGAITLFINGISQTLTGTTTLTTGTTGRNYLTLGQWNGGTAAGSYGLFKGYVSNLRVVKASTYTTNFTPSTAPLTAITNTSLLICQSNRFMDNSSNAFTITPSGSPSVQSFQPFLPSLQYTPSTQGGSGYFDGSGDYLQVSPTGGMGFGTNNFTIEFWVYPIASPTTSWNPMVTMGASGGGQEIRISQNINGTGFGYLIPNNASSADVFAGFGTLALNTWHHMALVRNGSTVTFYRNGSSVGSTSSVSFNFTNTGPLLAGYGFYPSDGYFPGGYIADLRVVNGTAVYTSTFTPPSAPLTAIANTQLLLSTNSSAIFDNSGMNNLETVGNTQVNTSVIKYGTGSMYFDGSGDYLAAPASTNTTFGSTDFTIEMWVNAGNQSSTGARVMGNGAGASWGSGKWIFTTYSGDGYKYQFNWWNYSSGTTGALIGTSATNTSIWNHVAVTRQGNIFKLFVNGVQESTVTSSTSVDNGTAAQIRIGASGVSGDAEWAGYIDDLRITKGVARYVTNFTPPVARMPNQ